MTVTKPEDNLTQDIRELRREIKEGFASVDARFEKTDAKIDSRFDTLNGRIDQIRLYLAGSGGNDPRRGLTFLGSP